MSASADDDYPDSSHPACRQALITPVFVLTWIVNFTQYLAFYLLITTMALYAVQEFSASNAMSGLTSSAFVIGATVARLFAGYVVDTFGRRRILLLALIVVLLACLGYVLPHSLAWLIALRILHGIGYALVSTATMAIVQSAIPETRRAEGTGYYALGSTLATAIGPALGLFFVESFTYTLLFWATVATALIGFVLGLVLHQHPSQLASAPAQAQRSPFSLRVIVDAKVVPIGCFMLLVGISYAGVLTYLLSYADQRHVVTGASYFFLAYAAAMLVMRFVLGRLQDRRGDNMVIYFGLLMFTAALVVLMAATHDWHVIAAGALSGLGYGTLMPASQAIAVRLVSPQKLGTGISTLLLLMDVGIGLGPIALGWIVTAIGYGPMFGMLAGLVVVAAVFYYVVHGRYDVAKTGVAG